jgi:hypothetical protein
MASLASGGALEQSTAGAQPTSVFVQSPVEVLDTGDRLGAPSHMIVDVLDTGDQLGAPSHMI